MRIGRIFFGAVLLLCLFEMTRLWNISPQRMAAHFNALGEPDRFVLKPEFFWFQVQTLFLIVLVSLPLQVLFLVIPPNLIHMPNRDHWLAPERKEETLGRLNDFGSWMFAVILLAVLAAFEISVYANLQVPIHFNAGLMGMVMAAALGILVWMLVRLMMSFRLPK